MRRSLDFLRMWWGMSAEFSLRPLERACQDQVLPTPASPGDPPYREGNVMLELGAIFTLLFVTLGPLKLLGPFAQQTRTLPLAALRGIAVRVFVVGLIATVAGAFIGVRLAAKWHVSVPDLLIATGVIFFLVAIDLVMAPYGSVQPPLEALPEKPMAATLKLTFPLVVTPYGIAALIAIVASVDRGELTKIYLLLLLVMMLNLLGMLFIRQIMRPPVLLVLQVLGSVLGVLQVALAVQFIIRALRDLHIIPT
jgi:multiple antibiotic resistance protein